MPIALNRNRYQEGALERAPRAKGPDVWIYRWRELSPDGKRVQRKRVIGTVERYRTLSEAKRASDNLRLAANTPPDARIERVTVGQAWGDFQKNELSDAEIDRSATTIEIYESNFARYILPAWRDVPLEDVTPAKVEKWLRSLMSSAPLKKPLAPATKAKIRNQMSCLFSHARRHQLFFPREGINPIRDVRQGAKRQTIPDILTLAEIRKILAGIDLFPVRLMVLVAATTALRRSEIRGLQWRDADLDALWFNLQRGAVQKHITKMKTEASRKGIPMMPELAMVLAEWRHQTPYNQPEDWIFASPYTNGKRPYWAESALSNHVLPAVQKAGIKKKVGWHTFRRSFACAMGDREEDIKVVQELMRHSSSRLTLDVYQQGAEAKKRLALTHSASLFAPAS
jgi:integrase